MKNANWGIGVPLNAIISVLGSFPILLHFSTDEFSLFIRSASYNFILTSLIWFIFHQVLGSKYLNLPGGKARYFIFCIATTVLLAYLLNLFFRSVFGQSIKPLMEPNGYRHSLLILFRGVMLGSLIAFIVNYLHVIKERQSNALLIEHLKQKQLQANLSSLKEQMSPHFLFNSLNSLIAVIKTDRKSAVNFVFKLSDVYRYLLQHREHQTVSLCEELEFITAYFFLLKVRFKNNINITIDIPEQYLETRIPPLTLQLLIENAVKHNIVSKTNPLDIGIHIEEDNILVSNTIQPKISLEASHGFGLVSMEEQYLMLTNKKITIKQEAQKFIVALPLIH